VTFTQEPEPVLNPETSSEVMGLGDLDDVFVYIGLPRY
jgi:hypothetical protein